MTEMIEALKSNLRNGIVEFTYTKKDGSARVAIGTLDLNRIPAESHPKGTSNTPANKINYWDVEKAGWRSFNEDQLVDAGELYTDDMVEALYVALEQVKA